MECCTIMYAFALDPDIDEEDVRLGRLIMLVVGLSVAVVARLITLLW